MLLTVDLGHRFQDKYPIHKKLKKKLETNFFDKIWNKDRKNVPGQKFTRKSCEQKFLKQNVVGKMFVEKIRKKFEDRKQILWKKNDEQNLGKSWCKFLLEEKMGNKSYPRRKKTKKEEKMGNKSYPRRKKTKKEKQLV